MIASEQIRLRTLGHEIEVGSDAVEFLVRQGYHRTLGARPMRATVERFLQDAVAESVLSNGKACGCLTVTPATEGLVLTNSPRLPVL